MKLKFSTLLFFSVGVLALYGLFWPGAGSSWVELTIEPGMSAHQVASELQQKGLFQFTAPFLVWSRLRGADSKIKLGRYRFPKGRSAYWVVDDFIKGRSEKVRLVIPEGFASWQIAERLDSLGLCSGPAFLKVVQI